MRESTFKQNWEVKGAECTVQGEIIVSMNYTSKTVTQHNRVTHEDKDVTLNIHRIAGFINKSAYTSIEVDSKDKVLIESSRIKKEMTEMMTALANSKPIKTFTDKMTELGFSN